MSDIEVPQSPELQPIVGKVTALIRADASYKLQPMVADIKMEIAARLDEALTRMGYPEERGRHQKVADLLKVSRETVRKWLEGESIPETHRLADIASRSNLAFEYLATGRGNQILEPLPLAWYLKRWGAGLGAQKFNEDRERFVASEKSTQGFSADSQTDYVYVRRISGAHLAAGSGEVVWDFEEIDKSHSFRREWMQEMGLNADRCTMWTVKGPSMEPNYNHGDIVLVNMANRTPAHGKVFALAGDDGGRMKRLIRSADKSWIMRSDNEDKSRFPDEPIIDNNYVPFGSIEWKAGRAV